jgi:putative transposase
MEEKHKKCKRFNQRGDAHFLTFTCYKRQPFLIKDRSKQWLLESLLYARHKHNFHLWAYVIMPEHVHLLLWPTTPEYSISKILRYNSK